MCVITTRSFSIYLVRIAKCSRQTNLNQIDRSSKQTGQYFKVEWFITFATIVGQRTYLTDVCLLNHFVDWKVALDLLSLEYQVLSYLI